MLEDSDFQSLRIPDVEYIVASRSKNFLSEYYFSQEALEIVAEYLPILVKLYEFIHREISYRITKDTARKLTIQGMIDQFKKHFSREDTNNLKEMITSYYSKAGNC